MAQELREHITKRKEELAICGPSETTWSWVPWTLPLAGPLFMLLLILLLGPC
jgi:hypothetical protein